MSIDRISTVSYENFTIDRVVISQGNQGYEISDSFLSMIITEDLTGGLIKGKLLMNNTIDFIDSYLNPDGTERLQISFCSKDTRSQRHKTFVKLFRIVSYDVLEDANTFSRSIITFNFESIGAINNEFIRVSKSYKGVGTHFIVKDMLSILGYTDDEMNIEQTLYNKDIIIPNITPLSAIAKLVNSVVSGDTTNKGDSNFYFYENRDKINFVSGSSLTTKDAVKRLIYDSTVDEKFIDRVIKFQRHLGYDLRKQVRSGALGISIMSNSLIDKSYRIERISDDKIKSIFKPMNGDNWHSDEVDSGIDACYLFSPEDHMYKFINIGANGNSIAINKINRSNLNAKSAFIRIAGNTNLTVGDVIDISVPSQSGKTNTRDSGKWLIKQINHVINRESYIMDMEIISDSDIRRV